MGEEAVGVLVNEVAHQVAELVVAAVTHAGLRLVVDAVALAQLVDDPVNLRCGNQCVECPVAGVVVQGQVVVGEHQGDSVLDQVGDLRQSEYAVTFEQRRVQARVLFPSHCQNPPLLKSLSVTYTANSRICSRLAWVRSSSVSGSLSHSWNRGRVAS